MYKQLEKPKENKNRVGENSVAQKKGDGKRGFGFVDNRTEVVAQRQQQEMAGNNSYQHQQSIQKKENSEGLTDNHSGYSIDDAEVHYNSDRPSPLQTATYVQDTYIHGDKRQEKHIPHKLLRVVQRNQGKINPAWQMNTVSIKDTSTLKREAGVTDACTQMPDVDNAISVAQQNVTPEQAPVRQSVIQGYFNSYPDEEEVKNLAVARGLLPYQVKLLQWAAIAIQSFGELKIYLDDPGKIDTLWEAAQADNLVIGPPPPQHPRSLHSQSLVYASRSRCLYPCHTIRVWLNNSWMSRRLLSF